MKIKKMVFSVVFTLFSFCGFCEPKAFKYNGMEVHGQAVCWGVPPNLDKFYEWAYEKLEDSKRMFERDYYIVSINKLSKTQKYFIARILDDYDITEGEVYTVGFYSNDYADNFDLHINRVNPDGSFDYYFVGYKLVKKKL